MDGTAARPNKLIRTGRGRLSAVVFMAAVVSALLVLVAVTSPLRASAAIVPTVNLRTAESYSILAGEAITNTGPTTVDGDVGVSPGTAVGLTEAQVEGEIHSADGAALQAKADLVTAYDNAAGRAVTQDLAVELGGQRLIGGVYKVTSEAQITGTLTLDGQNNPSSVFIFQVPSALGAQSNSTVNLINGASSCNVFWQVGSSATIGVGSAFVGTVMALTSVAVQTGATVAGRALARNAEVTLDSNVFTSNECEIGETEAPPVTVTPTVTAPPTTVTPTVTAPPVTVTPTLTAPPVTVTPTITAAPVTLTPTITATPTSTATPTGTASATPTVIETDAQTESPTATGTGTATATAPGLTTESALETENAAAVSTSTTESLASTGSSGTTAVVGVAGALVLLLGGALLAISRLRTRPKQRH